VNESYLYVGSAVCCVGAFVLAFVIASASLVANRAFPSQESGQDATDESSTTTLI